MAAASGESTMLGTRLVPPSHPKTVCWETPTILANSVCVSPNFFRRSSIWCPTYTLNSLVLPNDALAMVGRLPPIAKCYLLIETGLNGLLSLSDVGRTYALNVTALVNRSQTIAAPTDTCGTTLSRARLRVGLVEPAKELRTALLLQVTLNASRSRRSNRSQERQFHRRVLSLTSDER